MKYDKILISIGEYEQKIRDCLISKYGVNDSQIVTYRSGMEGFCWEEERIIALRKCITLIKERNVLGDMAEVGVYTGEFAKLFNRYLPERRLYLFDTFEGFDSSRDEIEDRDKKIFKDTSVELVLSKMKTPENCIVRKGYFPDTAKGVDGAFSLVSLDCDLYNPILAGLTFFYPRLSRGGYIFVHDFGSNHYRGVKRAVYQYCDENSIPIVPIADRCASVIISK